MKCHSYKLNLPLRLHSLNEYITANRKKPIIGANMKRDDQAAVEWYIRSQLRGIHIKHPVRMHYAWYEPNKRRDLDNVSSYGRKIIQDALVSTGVLKDDSWKQITGFTDAFFVDRKTPHIEVEIEVET